MKRSRIDKILMCVDTNYEELSFFHLTFFDVKVIIFQFLELISVIMTLIFFLVYVFFTERGLTVFFAIVAVYVAFVALIVTTADIRERLIRDVELLHNIRKIQNLYLDDDLFNEEYPIIKSLLMLKQKHPEISLLQLRKFDRDIFTTGALLRFLYDMNS